MRRYSSSLYKFRCVYPVILHLLVLAEITHYLPEINSLERQALFLSELSTQVDHLYYWVVAIKADQENKEKNYIIALSNEDVFTLPISELDKLWHYSQTQSSELVANHIHSAATTSSSLHQFSHASPGTATSDDEEDFSENLSPLFQSSLLKHSASNSPNLFSSSLDVINNEEITTDEQTKQLQALSNLKLKLEEMRDSNVNLGIESLPLDAINELFQQPKPSATEVEAVYKLVDDFLQANESLQWLHQYLEPKQFRSLWSPE